MVSTILTVLLGGAALSSAAAVVRPRDNSADEIWCGQVLYGKDFKTVEASWVVPNVSYPADANMHQQYYSSQWVGIDGAGGSDCKGLFQAGTSVGLDQGHVWHYPWIEFFPAETQDVDLDFSVGDTIYVKLTANSKTSGTMYMENETTGKSTTKSATAPDGAELCFESVEWIEEDPGGGLPFPAFTSFSFSGAGATDSKGNKYNLAGSDGIDLVQEGQTLCVPTVKSNTTLQFDYTGKRHA